MKLRVWVFRFTASSQLSDELPVYALKSL